MASFLQAIRRYSYAQKFTRDFHQFIGIRHFTPTISTFSTNALEFRKPKLRYKAIIGDLGNTIIPGDPMIHSMQMAFYNIFQIIVHHSKLLKGFGDTKTRQIQTILFDETGRFPSDHDVQLVEQEFNQQLMKHYKQFGVTYLPGTLEGMHILHRNGILFGCTTGLSNEVIDQINTSLSSSMPRRPWPIVHAKRPSGDGIHQILQTWNFGKPASLQLKRSDILKVGDSESDQWEASNAGVDFCAIVQHRAQAENQSKDVIIKEFQRRAFGSTNDLGIPNNSVLYADTLDDVAKMFCPWHRHGVVKK